MSIAVLNLVWNLKYSTPLTNQQRFVLTAMADTADDHGYLWPTVAAITRKTGISNAQVRVQINTLEERGWLTRSRRRHASHLGSYNYWLNLDQLYAWQEPRSTAGSQAVDKRLFPGGSEAPENKRAEPPIENHQEPPNPPKGGNRRIENCFYCSELVLPGEGTRIPSGVVRPRYRYVHQSCLGSDRYKRVHH